MSEIYYKATRPNGTDFRTGRVEYRVGKRVRPLPFVGYREICGPGYLHAAKVPAMTLIGGSWPCRLFEVSGRPAVGFDTLHPDKGGFRQLVVVREIDAHLALGPNGRYVAQIIERVKTLTQDEIIALCAVWDAARGAARDAVWGAVWDAARGAVWGAVWDAVWGAVWDAARGAVWDAARGAARDAVWGAVWAVVVCDLLDATQFDLLYSAWGSVIDPEGTMHPPLG